jgi:broad specificity phosphatase PhoE
MAAQLIHVVRHAHAGDRSRWTLDDDLRPLSERGCGQAERLADRLAAEGPQVIYSSASLRCIATVLPLARTQRLPVTTLDVLYEGGRASAMLDRLRADPASSIVASTHGDIVEDLLRVLARASVKVDHLHAELGSTWSIEISNGKISSARYAPPP